MCRSRGAAIEVRINAEDPDRNFQPAPGHIAAISWPAGPGVRIELMLYPGCAVPPYYDSLLAKIIVHAEIRDLALARLRRALDEFAIDGVVTTAGLHKRLARLSRSAGCAIRHRIFGAMLTAQGSQAPAHENRGRDRHERNPLFLRRGRAYFR